MGRGELGGQLLVLEELVVCLELHVGEFQGEELASLGAQIDSCLEGGLLRATAAIAKAK